MNTSPVNPNLAKTPLCLLAEKYKTDKAPSIFHSYTPYYHELLKDRRDKVRRVLEIGIGYPETMRYGNTEGYVTGASLYMWRDYFPNAEIYALDNKLETMVSDLRIFSMLCDQAVEKSLVDVAAILKKHGPFDLIIDDGSHVPEHQALTAKVLAPLLAPDGLYIIEDVLHPERTTFGLPLPYEVKDFQNPTMGDDRVVVMRNTAVSKQPVADEIRRMVDKIPVPPPRTKKGARPVTIVVLSKYREVLNPFAGSVNKYYANVPVTCVLDGLHDFEEGSLGMSSWLFIKGPEQFSMAGNANLGLRAVPADHDVLYVGDDIRFLEPNTVERLQQVAYLNNAIGILSARLLGRASPALAQPPEGQSFTYVRPLEFWFPCVYIKREVINKVGYLDEQFNQFGGDDLDYCIRVQKAGYKLAVTPRVTVQHESSPEGGPTTFVKNLGLDEWQRQQARAFEKLQSKYGVDGPTFKLFLDTNDMRLLDPSAPPALRVTSSDNTPVPMTVEQRSLANVDFEGQGKRGLAGKSLFVMTPMYGGQCTMNYVISLLNLIELCRKFGVQMSYMFLHNESLITRARNRMIDHWDKMADATHGVFIDADIGFDPNDILVALDMDLDIAGFPCVKKSIRFDRVQDLVKKFSTNGHAGAGREFKPEELSLVAGDFILNFADFNGKKTFNLGEPQLAHSVGTGIMMISKRVIDGLKAYYPDNYYVGSHTDQAALPGKIYDHFQVGINPESRDYDSEDYRFCINSRKAGFKVWVLPWTKTTHAGTYVFAGDLPTMSSLMPEWAR